MIEINTGIGISEHELSFSFERSPGPGGQNVNKVNTKATLRWNPRRSESLSEAVRQRFLARYGRDATELLFDAARRHAQRHLVAPSRRA